MRGGKKKNPQTHTSHSLLLLLLARTVEARRVVTKPPTRVSPSLFTPDISAAAVLRSSQLTGGAMRPAGACEL